MSGLLPGLMVLAGVGALTAILTGWDVREMRAKPEDDTEATP